jgi:replicative DNA helicase
VSYLTDGNRAQLAAGARFVLDAPDHVPAIVGSGSEVLWSEGEHFMLTGPPSVGKSTLAQQVALRRAGVLDGELIGLPVKADPNRLTLYLALDRPLQIARSMRRMVEPNNEHQLGQLPVWRGPLPFNLAKDPEALAAFTLEIAALHGEDIGTVVIDSLKDVAAPLSNDDVGAAVNRAIACLLAKGVEVLSIHHMRKATSENKKPCTLADVFGSAWLTAGAGSVALLWGQPGDPIVELSHLKPPADEIGPFELTHEHDHGTISRGDRMDVLTALQHAATDGLTATDAARAIYGSKATRADIEKARRQLEKLIGQDKARKVESDQTGTPTRFYPTSTVEHRGPHRVPPTPATRTPTNGVTEPHAPPTLPHAPTVIAPDPLKGAGRDGNVHDQPTASVPETLTAHYRETA